MGAQLDKEAASSSDGGGGGGGGVLDGFGLLRESPFAREVSFDDDDALVAAFAKAARPRNEVMGATAVGGSDAAAAAAAAAGVGTGPGAEAGPGAPGGSDGDDGDDKDEDEDVDADGDDGKKGKAKGRGKSSPKGSPKGSAKGSAGGKQKKPSMLKRLKSSLGLIDVADLNSSGGLQATHDKPPRRGETTDLPALDVSDLVLDVKSAAAMLHLPEEAALNLFKVYDKDKDGVLDLREFATFVILFSRGSSRTEIATARKVACLFRLFDTDNSGDIDVGELTLMLDTIHATVASTGFTWTEEERKEQIRQAFEFVGGDVDDYRLGDEDELGGNTADDEAVRAGKGGKSGKGGKGGKGQGGKGTRKGVAGPRLSRSQFVAWCRHDRTMQFFLRRMHALCAEEQVPLSDFDRPKGDKRVRVLCLDGGGMKGVMTAVAVARIEKACPGFLRSIDVFAGTSVGALLAASYAMNYHPDKVLADFLVEAPRMFESYSGSAVADAKRLVTAANSNEYFQQGVAEAFGGVRLGDLTSRILIPTFKLSDAPSSESTTGPPLGAGAGGDLAAPTWRPKFFHNFPRRNTARPAARASASAAAAGGGKGGKKGGASSSSSSSSRGKRGKTEDGDFVEDEDMDTGKPAGTATVSAPIHTTVDDADVTEQLADVVMRSMAAPTYFPSYQGYIDGGVVSNNPSMCALAQVIAPEYGGHNVQEVRLLSLGTGESPEHIDGEDKNWGLAQWARPLFSILSSSSESTAHFQCRMILGEQHYRRFSPVIPAGKETSIDDPKDMPVIQEVAEQADMTELIDWLKDEWM